MHKEVNKVLEKISLLKDVPNEQKDKSYLPALRR